MNGTELMSFLILRLASEHVWIIAILLHTKTFNLLCNYDENNGNRSEWFDTDSRNASEILLKQDNNRLHEFIHQSGIRDSVRNSIIHASKFNRKSILLCLMSAYTVRGCNHILCCLNGCVRCQFFTHNQLVSKFDLQR